eukprot:m.207435 g.207435  ORF g.207435 m.207435 type:complete len:346 (-) comp18928_c0_seq1:407-1444(-)
MSRATSPQASGSLLASYNVHYFGAVASHHAFPVIGQFSSGEFMELVQGITEHVKNFSECTRECDTQKIATRLTVSQAGQVCYVQTSAMSGESKSAHGKTAPSLSLAVHDIMSYRREQFTISGKKKDLALLMCRNPTPGLDTIVCHRFAFTKGGTSEMRAFFKLLKEAFRKISEAAEIKAAAAQMHTTRLHMRELQTCTPTQRSSSSCSAENDNRNELKCKRVSIDYQDDNGGHIPRLSFMIPNTTRSSSASPSISAEHDTENAGDDVDTPLRSSTPNASEEEKPRRRRSSWTTLGNGGTDRRRSSLGSIGENAADTGKRGGRRRSTPFANNVALMSMMMEAETDC